MKAYVNSKRLRPIAAGVAVAIGTMTFHPAVAQVKGQPTLPGEPCQTEPLENWTPQEQWVWSKVCVGEIADFNTEPGYGGVLDPNEPEDWPESRVLTSRFLETILLDEPFRSAQTRRGVRIVGAWFDRPIDLTGAQIDRELWLTRSRLDKGGSLVDARTGVLSLTGSVVGGQLRMNRAEIGGLFMREAAVFQEVSLRGATIGGQLSMNASTFAGTLDMASVTVKGHLYMRGAEFQEVDLIAAKIGGQLSMNASTFAGTLDMNGATVEGDLFMYGKAKFQDVSLLGAKIGENIGDQLVMNGSTFAGKLDMNGTTVEGSLLMVGVTFQEDVILRAAKIARQIEMQGSTFAGTLDVRSATVGGNLYLDEVTLTKELNGEWLSVGGNLDLYTAEVSEINLRGATIDGQLDMRGSTFAGTLDMRRATVGGDLLLIGADLTEAPLLGRWLSVGRNLDLRADKVSRINLRGATVVDELRLFDLVWKAESILDLREAKVGRLVARVDKSNPVSTMLAGFMYDALGSTESETPESNPAEEAADFVERWLGNEEVHSRQAHEQFAAVLRQMGFRKRATQTLYEGKSHELWEELRRGNLLQAGWLFLLWAVIGYGYRVWLALVWIAALVAVGWLIARKSGSKLPGSGEPLGFWYSIERLLPIVELNKRHYEVDLPWRSRVYFYIHTVAGFLLATILLAELSGVVG